ncbi:MAG: hypothetical protein AAFP84_02025, partial [Actinomycetota bacterium]
GAAIDANEAAITANSFQTLDLGTGVSVNQFRIDDLESRVDALDASPTAPTIVTIDQEFTATTRTAQSIALATDLELDLWCYGGSDSEPHIGWDATAATNADVTAWDSDSVYPSPYTEGTLYHSDPHHYQVRLLAELDGVTTLVDMNIIAKQSSPNSCEYNGIVEVRSF